MNKRATEYEPETLLDLKRIERNLTHEQGGELLGVTGQAFGRYCKRRDGEKASREPRSPEVRRRLREEFGLTIDNFRDPPPKRARKTAPKRRKA